MTVFATRVLLLLLACAGPLAAQGVLLELRPRVGDTLRLRLDQEMEVVGTRVGSRPLNLKTTVRIYSRVIVVGMDGPVSLIIAVTDSMSMESNDQHVQSQSQEARRQLEGRQLRIRLLPDGTLAMSEDERGVSRQVRDMVAIMPGSFPKEPIAVGDTWVRVMPVPGAAPIVPTGGVVRARFRLDSLSRTGDLAFVSMKGTFESPEGEDREDAPTGSVSGGLVVNRNRGWISESRFTVDMRTTIPGSAQENRRRVRFRTKITQLTRVLSERRP